MVPASWTGQRGLQPLPLTQSRSSQRTVASFPLPPSLVQPPPTATGTRSSSPQPPKPQPSGEDYGLPILKVSKTGKLLTRRIALTPDHRYLLITTHRYKHTPGRLWKGLVSTVKRTATPHRRKPSSPTPAPHSSEPPGPSPHDMTHHTHPTYLTTEELQRYRDTQTIKLLPLASVDRVQRGSHSHRFALARREALQEPDGHAVVQLLDQSNYSSQTVPTYTGEPGAGDDDETNHTTALPTGACCCLSIVYYTTTASRTTGTSAHKDAPAVGMHAGGLALYPSTEEASFMPYTQLETLDIIVPHAADFDVLYNVLESLVVLHAEERQRYSSHLLALNAQLVDMGGGWHADLGLQEFTILCDRLQVPLPRAQCQALFRRECDKYAQHARHALTMTPRGEPSTVRRLSYAVIASLLQEIRDLAVATEKDPLERLWRDLVATDPVPPVGWQGAHDPATVEINIPNAIDTISAVAFLSFLRSQQKEYSTSLEEAVELIHILEQVLLPEDLMGKSATAVPQTDRLSKHRFFAFLMADANDLLHPARAQVGADDMTRPLSHYWINTSHDTYLAPLGPSLVKMGGEKNAYARQGKFGHLATDEQAFMAALLRGVRCLELDIWDSWDGKVPVLGRHGPRSASDKVVPLDSVLRSVRVFLEQQPFSYPVILKIENHCSYSVQVQMSRLLQKHLGSADLIVEPTGNLNDSDPMLPSPESIRGKVLIIGKRPAIVGPGRRIRNDDFDVDIDIHRDPRVENDDTTSHELDDDRVVIGFNEKGPIRSEDVEETVRSPDELYAMTAANADRASQQAREAEMRATELLLEAEELEQRSEGLIQASGLTRDEIKRRAELASSKGSSTRDAISELIDSEEKSNKEEGLEVHEVLPDFVHASRSNYEDAAKAAMEAAGHEAQCHMILRDMEEAYRMAKANLDMSQAQQKLVTENARRAAAEARTHHEHAMSAKLRVEKVRELLGNSRDQSSSAGNVVQTALTEAKISEKRAVEAESKAKRAAATAEQDRVRADTETKREEMLEHEVNDLHHECMESTEAAKACRDRVEKATSMMKRLDEQISLIERSSQFRRELAEAKGSMNQPSTVPGSFMEKHVRKLEERAKCKALIQEASQECSAAELRRNRLQRVFEEKAYLWKKQAEIAAQARKTADRSSHIAEELAEDAAEEREAANLRHIARVRAEATVEDKGSYLNSFEAQLAEAEKAANDAASIAAQSKKKAEHFEREVEKVKDHSRFIQALESADVNRKSALEDFERAKSERERRDKAMMEEKIRLDTSADVFESATRAVASEGDRKKIELFYQQEALISYIQAFTARKEAEKAGQELAEAISKADIMRRAANKALEYKEVMRDTIEIPVDLAKATFLHSSRFQTWRKSLSLPSAIMHSLSHNILLLKIDEEPKEHMGNLQAFTKSHLVRIFPSWREIHRKSCSNYDPVFAWALGCQLVSTNFHSMDENLIIAEGRFRQNGSCGYALKPQHLTSSSSPHDQEQQWTFSVLGAFNLPKPEIRAQINPIVKVSIYSGSTKEMRISYRTKPANNNGFNPTWASHNKFTFTIASPSVSMLAFSVWHVANDGSEHFVAAAAFPAGAVREGYRSVALFDGNHNRFGSYSAACLLVKAVRR